jgi:hypothetical protein
MTNRRNEASASDHDASRDAHVDEQSGARVPTPDPKDQTGDPEEDMERQRAEAAVRADDGNPAMRELRRRQNAGDITES